MPRRALRCVVDLNIDRVSAPGVWLPSKEDVYLSISLFGQYRNTRNVCSVFPLPFYEPFRFEKTYYTACDPQDVAEFLDDELVVIELLQYSDYTDGAIRLASYSTSAREFLFPYPSLCPSYTSASKEVLLSRTIAWPGISPKLEFSTSTIIKESRSPELDALEDALEEEKIVRRARSRSRSRTRSRSLSRSRSRTRTCSDAGVCLTITRSYSPDSDSGFENYDSDPHYMRPTISSIFRSRSSSGVRNESDIEAANKAPFVVRHLETDLIGRKPGAPALKTKKAKKKKSKKKSASRPSSALSGYDRAFGLANCPVCSKAHRVYISGLDCLVCKAYRRHMGRAYWGHGPNFHPTGRPCCNQSTGKVIRDGADALPVYTTKYMSDDDDLEVAELTSRPLSVPLPRPRSASPYLYKPSYSSRFRRALSPSLSESDRLEIELAIERARTRARLRSAEISLADKLEIDLAIERARARARARALAVVRSRSPSPVRSFSRTSLRSSMEDLALDTSIAKNRSLVHLSAGQYWTQRAAELSGKSHRGVFKSNMNKIYNGLLWNATKQHQKTGKS